MFFALVAGGGVLECPAGSVGDAGEGEHFAEVAVNPCLELEDLGLVGDRDRLAGEPCGVRVPALAGEEFRLDLPADGVGGCVVAGADLGGAADVRLRLVSSRPSSYCVCGRAKTKVDRALTTGV